MTSKMNHVVHNRETIGSNYIKNLGAIPSLADTPIQNG